MFIKILGIIETKAKSNLFPKNRPSTKIAIRKKKTKENKVHRIWMDIICLVIGLNCFLTNIIRSGIAMFAIGIKIKGKDERLIILRKGKLICLFCSLSRSDSFISNTLDKILSVCPFGSWPDSIRCIVLTEISDFSDSSSWVKLSVSLIFFNFEILVFLNEC